MNEYNTTKTKYTYENRSGERASERASYVK